MYKITSSMFETNAHVITGLENLCFSQTANAYKEYLKGKRLGILANPASVDRKFRHVSSLITQIYPDQLKAIFSPQHGFNAEKQDNMIESEHSFDPILRIPIFSLYSNTRIPTKEMFDLIDTLIVDIQDVGTRVYTFIYTISYCLEVAAQYGKEVVILDRPNPIGGRAVEGNILNKEYSSFVGRFPLPMRHGLTVGEIANLFNSEFIVGKKCDLTVVPMIGWKRDMLFADTNLPWIAPSPNLPNPISALVYPGQVIWEGTNVSEGRGTTQPFETFGAPYIETQRIIDRLVNTNSNNPCNSDTQSSCNYISTYCEHSIQGVILRPIAFEPTSGKWQGKVCRGFQLHIVDPNIFKPYKTSLLLLQMVINHHSEHFRWKEPPYEYEYQKMPIDLILGDKGVRESIQNLENLDIIEASWQSELEKFKLMSRKYHIYD